MSDRHSALPGSELGLPDCGQADTTDSGSAGGRRPLTKPSATSSSRSIPNKKPSNRAPIVIIDKSAVFRAGLRAVLTDTPFRIIAEFASLSEFNEAKLQNRVDAGQNSLLLIGLDEEVEAGCQWVPNLTDAGFHVILLVARFWSATVLDAIKAGVGGYLLKDQVDPVVLLNALELVQHGSIITPRGWARGDSIVDIPSSSACDEMAHISPLSKGDLSILELLTHGASNKDIAWRLGIAEATVKVRIGFLLRKLRLSNRTQAAMWATQNLTKLLGLLSGICVVS